MIHTTVAPAEVKQAIAEISDDLLMGTVRELSSQQYAGRRYDTAENTEAAQWLATQLDRYNVPAPKQGRIQTQGNIENVLGFIAGEDQSETIVIAAHFDHLGVDRDQVFFGADDNASGCAAVLEIARAFVQSGIKPKRNVVFAFFDGEEFGKYGSKHYLSIVDTPHWIAIHDPPVFMINFDMVGRLGERPLLLSGFASSTKLNDWTDSALQWMPGFSVKRFKTSRLNGDHATFLAYGVPSLRLFSGEHADYHQPTDTEDKIDYPGLHKATQLGFLITWFAAMDEDALRPFVKPKHPRAISARVKIGLDFHDSLN